MTMRRMTPEERELWHRAWKAGAGYKEGTNNTPLNYILSGRIEELELLIKQAGKPNES